MHKMKNKLFVLICLLAALSAALAASISFMATPGGGSYTFSKQGGVLEVTIHNQGDLSGNFAIVIAGEGAPFIKTDSKVFVASKELGRFKLNIIPTTDIQYEKPYELEVYITPQVDSSALQGGTGAAVIPGLQLNYQIIVEKKGNAPTLYQSVSAPSSTQVITQDNALLILLLLIILAIIGGLYVYFTNKKKKQDEEWEEEVVIRRKIKKN